MSVSVETPQDKDPPTMPGSVPECVTNNPDQYDPTALAGMLKLTSRLDASNNSINEAEEVNDQEVDDQSVLAFIDELSMEKYDADEESDYDVDTEMDRHQDVDEVFEEIKESISRNLERKDSSVSHLSLSSSNSEGQVVKISDNFTSIPYGIQPRATYEHGKKSSDIMGVSYNGRMRQFIILDAKGVIAWKRDAVDARVTQALTYPKYEYRLITHLVYARKHNCYFALAKDFSLKVMNRDFVETCSVSADLSSVLFMLFNPVRDELITGGVGGTKVWHFHQVAAKAFRELKPLANFRLTLRYELPNLGGSWVKRVDLDYNLDHLYCCSDTDLHAYDMQGKLLFKFSQAHAMTITGCQYSVACKVLVTASVDSEVKVWSLRGGLVHTFRGHSRAVTHLLIHPDTSTIAITSSLDGTVRMWSLDTMDALYSLVVSSDGVLWMGLTDDNLLYISTARNISIWSLNYFFQFWSLARNELSNLSLVGCKGKTTRIVALGEDSSLRLFARSNQKNMSTVLPPPSISPLQKVLSVCYSREFSVVFMLVNPQEIWVYTTRTDPACRIAVWNIHEIQYVYIMNRSRSEQDGGQGVRPSSSSSILHGGQSRHRATESGVGNEAITNCRCLCDLNASAMMWTDEGFCCPVRHSYLLLGMEDGRILFMDPVVKGQKYMEFKASKDAIEDMRHDPGHDSLITLCLLKELMQIQIWSLPDLALVHEVYCAPDIAHYARINMTFLTGHKSGCVNDYTLTPAEDAGMYKAKAVPEFSEAVDIYKRPEHNEAIIALDACQTMKIFCSCSDEGAIKIWDEFRVLLTEITLDSTLSAACFLNDSGDMVVGFKKHMFFIDHTKVCPFLTPPETEPETFDQESFVYEDPAVMYEGAMGNPDPITLSNYLVPYELEFSKDFLEGKLQLDPMKAKKDEESEEESEFSMAPTEIYFSPPDTPKPLSTLDLTLGSEVSKYDLVKHMEKTLQILIERATTPVYRRERTPRQRRQSTARDSAGKKRKHRRSKITMAVSDEETDKEDETRGITPFEFPAFGSSPGPSPSPSTPPTPATPLSASSAEDSEDEGNVQDTSGQRARSAVTQEQKLQALIKARVDEIMPPPPRNDPWSKMVKVFVSKTVLKKEVKQEVDALKFSPKSKINLGDMKVDIKSLLKEKRHVLKVKEADHSHVKSEQTESVREKPKRQIQKKKAAITRKMPKRGQKGVDSVPGKLEQTEVKDIQEKLSQGFSHGRVGESDSGMDGEFISVSQRGMYLTETEVSEVEEERDVTARMLSDPGKISLKRRPASSFIDRQDYVQDSRLSKARPHTAANDHFTTELELIVDLPHSVNDLQAAFNAAMLKYQRISGSPLSPDKLYRNDGVTFDENWQDRAIERHMLLRMQKELRQYNAAQKRHLLEQRQRERQTSLFGHSDCRLNTGTAPRPGSSAYAVQQLERANTTMPLRSATAASSLIPQRPRPQTAHFGALKRQQQPKQSDRSDLAVETPFRFRLSPMPPTALSRAWSERKDTPDSQRKVDPQMLDPRNPHAIRPKSSRSIPSKCSRYILVSRPKDQNQPPIPSPMEEQLLFERFPNIGMKTLNTFDGTIIRQRKPTYGIEYSPFAPQMH
ncbi:uncharacterized protein LOC124133882 isoform X3 [Haliotis rufescens]|uniref:uncharacterized protein LOC124133882 isoform X3 n=1 Tax=Haliotis rufescens TaxID=6454 RepID=UPI00201E8070|nr:uncharacterized protein LOC124133882 isoform X3 [Haliotis rufescens]